MKTKTISAKVLGHEDFPENGLLGVAAAILTAGVGITMWILGTGGYELFGQGFAFFGTHMFMLHLGRYAGFAEYRERLGNSEK